MIRLTLLHSWNSSPGSSTLKSGSSLITTLCVDGTKVHY
jgi:hypothetical protein